MNPERMHVEERCIQSSYDALNEVVALVEETSGRMGLGEEDETDLMISVMEALNNAIQHGNHGDPSKHVHLKLVSSPEQITIWVRDEGAGFDLASVPDPTAPGNLLNRSGRGILMMKSFMDEVVFVPGSKGLVVKMTKRFAPASS